MELLSYYYKWTVIRVEHWQLPHFVIHYKLQCLDNMISLQGSWLILINTFKTRLGHKFTENKYCVLLKRNLYMLLIIDGWCATSSLLVAVIPNSDRTLCFMLKVIEYLTLMISAFKSLGKS